MTTFNISRSLPCALDSDRALICLRDISRLINYDVAEPGQQIARMSTPCKLSVLPEWKRLPKWVRLAEVSLEDGELKLGIAVESGTPEVELEGLIQALAAELSEMFAEPVRPYRTRVFCLGWSKTGTTSITAAMRKLGLFSWHCAPWVMGFVNARSESTNIKIDISDLARYDFVSDLPTCTLYRELDREYPGSLFILTTRPVDAWLSSAVTGMENNIKHIGLLPSIERWAYGMSNIDPSAMRKRYLRHQAEVMAYFAGRPDFLAIDLADGDPWPKLCGFLGLPVPAIPFPWLNKREILQFRGP